MGAFLDMPLRNVAKSIFNIITTNKNKTAMAPIYTTSNSMAKNSAPIKTNRAAQLKKVSIKNRTECTGLRETTTSTEDVKETEANK